MSPPRESGARADREYSTVAQHSQPTICVVSVFSRDLLLNKSFGQHAIAINGNWAIGHGYRYSIFLAERLAVGVPLVWAKPRAVLAMLERGADVCSHVLMLDADAVVNQLQIGVETLLARHLKDGVRVLMACSTQSDGSDSRDCGRCRCTEAAVRCSAAMRLHELRHNIECEVNTGVMLVHNDNVARQMFRWWAAGGAGPSHGSSEVLSGHAWRGEAPVRSVPQQPGRVPLCPLQGSPTPEQDCANVMGALWPGRLQVVGARVMNAAAWLSDEVYAIKRLGGFHGSRFERVCGYLANGTGWRVLSLSGQMGCYNSSAFVCHAYGFMSVQRGRLDIKRAFFARTLAAKATGQRHALEKLLAARGDTYRNFDTDTADSA